MNKLITEQQNYNQRQAEMSRFEEARSRLIHQLEERAAQEKWSERELGRRAGFSHSTWLRLRRGQLQHPSWLDRLRAACSKLGVEC